MGTSQILEKFKNPDKGYGIVSFFWWNGDKLTKDKLIWILDQLEDHSITGLQINYGHSNLGGTSYGLTLPSDPPLFSQDWWELVEWFIDECKKRGICVSLSDYTLGTPGQGWFADEMLADHPEMCGQVLEYKDDEVIITKVNKSYNPMAKGIGKAYISAFWGNFEKYFPNECGQTLNYFFSDELSFNVKGNLWCDDFQEEFIKRKGYDIMPYIKGIFKDIGDITPKIRMYYYDVIVQLSEERYFKVIYDWHESRGMTFGCDHGGRGRDVTEFGDYFRAMKWNQGPGCDEPQLRSDVIKNKVASSISHLYNRPRTWLEGFYGSGWGTSSAQILDAVYRNFVMGHNLLSLHGLYYTTYGSMWEWAPPCNHHHMPYWEHMKKITSMTERLSRIMTLGNHKCDVGIIYPVAPYEAGMNGNKSVKTAFDMANILYSSGIDFDFLDFESVARGKIENGRLHITNESYKIVIIPSMQAVRFSMIETLAEFVKNGGIVINIGDLPVASEHAGRNDEILDICISGMMKNGMYMTDDAQSTFELICDLGVFDFICSEREPYVQHRVIYDKDVYFVYGVRKGAKCAFNAKGQPHLLDPFTAEIRKIKDYEYAGGMTEFEMPLTETELHIIIFDDEFNDDTEFSDLEHVTYNVSGTWECELKPVLSNKYGDYRLPAFDKNMSAEVRRTEINGERCTNSYGTYFYKLGGLPCSADEDELLKLTDVDENTELTVNGKQYHFKPVRYSMRYGNEFCAGNQKSFHGLKGLVSDDVLILGEPKLPVNHFARYKSEADGDIYYFWTTVRAVKEESAKIVTGDIKPVKVWINGREVQSDKIDLKTGVNYILVKYKGVGRTHFMIEKSGAVHFLQKIPVSTYWYNNPNYYIFDAKPNQHGKVCSFKFTTPPGMETIKITALNTPVLYIDGRKIELKNKGDNIYMADVSSLKEVKAYMEIEQIPGCYGAALLPEPIGFECGKGEIEIGDWSKNDALECYSGGMWYRKNIFINKDSRRIMLDLGDVVSSAQVYVNGKLCDTLVAPPFKTDITEYARNGKNYIEILVYNTAANQFDTSPSFYKGSLRSGIIG